jgi:hypothetical protein
MAQAMLLPALVPAIGLAAVLFFQRPRHLVRTVAVEAAPTAAH